MKNSKKQNVVEKYVTLTEKIARNSNKAQNFGTDVEIYRSEIHIINIIGLYKGIHISEIARKFGVTKGAISKAIKKLEKKGLVEKLIDKDNNTRTIVILTDKGTQAYEGHEEYHQQNDKYLYSFFDSLNERELLVLETFLQKANEMVERHI